MKIAAGIRAPSLTLLGMTLATLAAPGLVMAQENGWSGSADLGYRFVSVDGNEDKYREDVNLSQGIRLFAVELSSYQADNSAMDEFLFSASGIGGDPYTRAGLRLRKARRYDLQIGYRSSDYFYQDAGYYYSDIGDLHTWNSRREFYDLNLSIHAADWVTVRVGAESMKRSGSSQTSSYVQREVFLLAQPVDQESMSFWLAADFHWGWADLTVEQRLNTYENRWQQTVSNSDGLRPGGSSLAAYSLLQVQDADTPVSRFQFSGTPHDSVHFTLGYAHMAADVDYQVDGAWNGIDFTGDPNDPFQTTLTNNGGVTRDSDLLDLDVTWTVVPSLDLTADVSYRTYDQDGTINFLESQTGGAGAGNYPVQGSLANRLDLLTYGLTADWRISSAWTVLAGAGMQTRDVDFDLTGPEVQTQRTIYRGGVGFRPSSRVDLLLMLETGEDEDPLTRISPTDIDRLSFRGRLRPHDEVQISFHYKDETRENLLSYPLSVPTDDVPPANAMTTAKFEVTSWGAFIGWTPDRFDMSLGYTRTEVSSNADITYITGFTFVPAFDVSTTLDQTGYSSDQDSVQAVFRMTLGRGWSAGALAALTRNTGTFPLDWRHYSADVRYRLPRGWSLRVAWDRYELDEDNPYAGVPSAPQPGINDYNADLWTAAVGYSF